MQKIEFLYMYIMQTMINNPNECYSISFEN